MIDTKRLDPNTVEVITSCCGQPKQVNLTVEQEAQWRHGALIQRIVDLPPDERELLISGTCGPCWDAMCKRWDL